MNNAHLVLIQQLNNDVFAVIAVNTEETMTINVDSTLANELKAYLIAGDSSEPFIIEDNGKVLSLQPLQGKLYYAFSDNVTVFQKNYSVKPAGRYHYTNE